MSRPYLLPLLVLATLMLGWLDYITGPRLSFGLFYLAPVSVAGWLLGARSAWTVTCVVGLAQFTADIAWGGQEASLITLWNMSTRVGVLGAMGHLLAWLRRDRDRLDQLLAERTSAHVATIDQLRHRDRLALVGQIASGLAHELGTPLNVVAGRARLMLESEAASPTEAGHVRAILEQAERMTHIIRQLLDFARRRGPDLGRVDLQALCDSVVELLRPLAKKRRVELSLRPAATDCAVAVDYNQLQQALSNLVMNAMQAMPDGGQVRMEITEQETELIVSVTDTGTGIAKEHQDRIFEPFFTTQGAGQGTGLGLSITEGIVRDHGGHIELDSEVGKGSCFRIHLPRRSVKPAPQVGVTLKEQTS
ncbi:MAG: hypothetical protein JNJ46_23250 [Myxococcales bacterium]|nr:hypothetical protein [Myxococcales bacterium]